MPWTAGGDAASSARASREFVCTGLRPDRVELFPRGSRQACEEAVGGAVPPGQPQRLRELSEAFDRLLHQPLEGDDLPRRIPLRGGAQVPRQQAGKPGGADKRP